MRRKPVTIGSGLGRVIGIQALIDKYPQMRWRMLVGSRRWAVVLVHFPKRGGESDG